MSGLISARTKKTKKQKSPSFTIWHISYKNLSSSGSSETDDQATCASGRMQLADLSPDLPGRGLPYGIPTGKSLAPNHNFPPGHFCDTAKAARPFCLHRAPGARECGAQDESQACSVEAEDSATESNSGQDPRGWTDTLAGHSGKIFTVKGKRSVLKVTTLHDSLPPGSLRAEVEGRKVPG